MFYFTNLIEIADDPTLSKPQRKQVKAQKKMFKKEYDVLGPTFDKEIMEDEPMSNTEVDEQQNQMMDQYEPPVIPIPLITIDQENAPYS